jgi:hypothetical protein
MLNASKFLELHTRQQESGLNVREFCSNEGIAPATFYYWFKKLRKNNQSKGFIPLVVKPPSSNHQRYVKGNSQSLSVDHTQEDAVFLELVYPNGTLLRVKKDMDFSLLRSLIHLYE